MVGQLKTVVWDAPDISALADFYVGAAGLTQHYADDEWVTLTSADGWRFGVQRAPDHVPPQWPDPAHPQQMHVDFRMADIDAAADHAESLGARRIGGQRWDDGGGWHVLADPAGHPFCFTQADVEGTGVFAVTFDTDDAPALGQFYSRLLGLDVTYEGPEGVLIGHDDQPRVMFQQVSDHRRPRWPDPAYPQQLHLDITVARIFLDLLAAEQGALVLTCSQAAFAADGGGTAYTASKGAVRSLVQQLSFELAPHIRVNAVAPTGIGNSQLRGPAALDLQESKQSDIPVDAFRAEFEWLAPLQHMPAPEEYGSIYALLASRQNRIITGQTVVADSGTLTRALMSTRRLLETMPTV